MVPMEKKKKKDEKVKVKLKRSKEEAGLSHSIDKIDTCDRRKKKKKLLKNKKNRNDGLTENGTAAIDLPNEIEGGHCLEDSSAIDIEENKKGKSRRKRRKSEKKAKADINANEVEENKTGKSRKKRKLERKTYPNTDANEVEENQKGKPKRKKRKSEKKTEKNGDARSYIDAEQQNGKQKKPKHQLPNADENFLQKSGEAEDVYEQSSGDENTSKGMRKWIAEYYQSRPGLQVLQEKIDEYIVAYDAEKEQERKEKEARVAEDGWTVVTHHKGRKKTTDSETGIAVGSVSQAAVIENMANKKRKDVGLNFYQFQKREAKRNEIMELQSKFEQDKKRAQQLRAARKFRPL